MIGFPSFVRFDFLVDTGFFLAFLVGAVGLSLVAYLMTRRMAGEGSHEKHRDMASAMVTRIGALHGLILALVFAQEMNGYQRLDAQTALEASSIADVFNDAGRYDRAALTTLRGDLIAYTRIAIDREWDLLASGKGLDGQAWALWNAAYEGTLNLNPQTPRQQSLREHMLDSLHAIASSRDLRENESTTSLANLFWFAAISGVVLIAMGHYIYAPDRHNIVLLCLFSAYTGVILFLIYAFSNPYGAPGALSPTALVDLRQELVAEAAGPTP